MSGNGISNELPIIDPISQGSAETGHDGGLISNNEMQGRTYQTFKDDSK
jgi:hypothetical protein